MIFRLAFKFYIRHAKRTVRGSKIIAISLVAIVVTEILILAFTTQLTGLTSLIENNDNYLVVTPGNNKEEFESGEFSEITLFLENNNRVISYFSEIQERGEIIDEINSEEITIHHIDIHQLNSQIDPNNFMFITSEFKQKFNIGEDLGISLDNRTKLLTIYDFLDTSSPSIEVGIYIDRSIFNKNESSHIYIQTETSSQAGYIQEILTERWEVQIKLSTAEVGYINDSKEDITKVLQILAFMISILIILGIFNLVRTILLESEFEIRVLKSIGYGINEIRVIYLILSGLLGLIGSILCIIFGLAIPIIVFSLMTITLNFGFIPSEITIDLILQVFGYGIISPLIAGLFPIWRIVK